METHETSVANTHGINLGSGEGVNQFKGTISSRRGSGDDTPRAVCATYLEYRAAGGATDYTHGEFASGCAQVIKTQVNRIPVGSTIGNSESNATIWTCYRSEGGVASSFQAT
jgi:hypothetical protein